MLLDENDQLRAGTLPADPEDGTVSMVPVGLEDWDEPIGFQELDVPAFPVDVLPPWIGAWCLEQARAIQVPHDLPALLALGVVSLACSKKVAVEIKPGWREPTNIYTAIALAPGLGKSPVFSAATAPLRQWEREERLRLAPQIATATERARSREERVRTLRKKAANVSSESERREIEHELEELAVIEADEPIPVAPRLIADDATPEAVGRLLAEQRGRLGVFSSEGGPFKILAGRYSADGRANCELFCKAHAGDAYDLDRIGRPSIHLAAPLVTVALTVQPDVIGGLASTPDFRSVGLLARFLYAIPRSALGKRHPDPEAVSEATREQYARVVRVLLELDERRDEQGEVVAQPVPLDDEARRALVRFKGALEPRLGVDGDLHSFADWGNKLPGMVARLAGILHVAEYASAEALGRIIRLETMERALHVGAYAIEHARAAFGLMGTDPVTELAKAIWSWALRSGQGAVTRHEIHRAMQRHAQRAVELDPALARLTDRGLLREVRITATRRMGRPSSPTFAINPRAKGVGS